MTLGRNGKSRQNHKLSAHPAFAPVMGLWGAALAGLSVMVMPASLIAGAAKGTGLMLLGDHAQPVLAALGAVVLGSALYLVSGGVRREVRRYADAPSIVATAARHVRAIDPQRDLGSASLDEPLAAMPFAEARPFRPRHEEPVLAEAPVELDLAAFAELPGRNAVWVEEPATAPVAAQPQPEPEPEPVAPLAPAPAAAEAPPAPASRPAHPSAAALARLRAAPPQSLSLAEMVERFAGALHEHREGASGQAHSGQDLSAREAALAEALKALAALSGQSTPARRDEPLRDALSQLQGLRGAA